MQPTRSLQRSRGIALLWVVVTLILLLAVTALSVDAAYMYAVRAELQTIADAASLAAASGLPDGPAEAAARARNVALANNVNGKPYTLLDEDIEFGSWNTQTRQFVKLSGGDISKADAVRINPRLTRDRGTAMNLLFAGIFGKTFAEAGAEAVAYHQPRDIMLVLDLSGSMNDDSELMNINSMGKHNVEANLQRIYQQMGSPEFGKMKWSPVTINSTNANQIKKDLGLQKVSYPYPGGSWEDYFSYVQNDTSIYRAGYRKKYGYLTLVNYWLARQAGRNKTPDLWKTDEQPLTAVKNAVSLYLVYLGESETEDRIGMAVYTAANGHAKIENGMTTNFGVIDDITRKSQAGHYHDMTNIGAGMDIARQELMQSARPGAFKMMVLMTDGIANQPYNTNYARQYAKDQADLARAANIPILTISLGSGADTDLMQEIADITGGIHFNIPGGKSVEEYEEDLREVFKQIAAHRPLKLVH